MFIVAFSNLERTGRGNCDDIQVVDSDRWSTSNIEVSS